MADIRDFLTRSGFPITAGSRRGLFNVAHHGTDLTADRVWDIFFRLYFWPEPWPPPERKEPPVPQRLCGG